MKIIYFFISIFFTTQFFPERVYSQFNLVPNPSFEFYTSCPTTLGQIKYATPWDVAIFNNSSDYFNSCHPSGWSSVPSNLAGFQFPRTGNAYAGIVTYSWNGAPTNYREYIQVELLDTLQQGVEYCLSFFVSPGDSCRRISNDFGAYFSNTFIVDSCGGLAFCNLPFQPQIENPSNNQLNDRTSWTEITGSFIADGFEKYLILGNFKDTSSSTSTITGWSNIPALNLAYYFIDDVQLVACDSATAFEEHSIEQDLQIYPSIAVNEITIVNESNLFNSFCIYNCLGEVILRQQINEKHETKIDVSSLKSGNYFINLTGKDEVIHKRFIKQ